MAAAPIASLPLADRVPVHGVPEGPRGFDWRATDPATLVYAEALDKGDWKVNVPHRDRVLMLKAPFNGKPVEITRTAQRFEGFAWTADPAVAFQYENDENRHWMQTRIVDVDQPKQEGRLLWDMSSDELYANPATWCSPAWRMARRSCAARATMCSSVAAVRRHRATARSSTVWTWAR